MWLSTVEVLLLTTNDEENELIALSLTFQTAAYEQIAQANQTTKNMQLGVS